MNSHDLKFGGDVSIIRAPTFFPRNGDGTFTFTTDLPFDPNNLATYPTQFTQSISDPNVNLDDDIYAVFVQDTWRVRTNLTLSMGVRYDRENAFSRIVGVPDDTNNIAPAPRVRVGSVQERPHGDPRRLRALHRSELPESAAQRRARAARQRHHDRQSRLSRIRSPAAPCRAGRPASRCRPRTSGRRRAGRSASGFKREMFSGVAVSADGVYSRGYNQFNNRDLNPRNPVTGTRPNPNFLRITQYETEGHAWYSALLMSLERRGAKGPGFGVSYTLVEGDPRRRGVPVPRAGSAQSGRGKGARQQQPDAPVRGPHELDAPRRRPDRRVGSVPLGPAVERHDRPRQQPRHRAERSAGPGGSERRPATIAPPTSRTSPTASATWDGTSTSARRSSRSTPASRSSSSCSGCASRGSSKPST